MERKGVVGNALVDLTKSSQPEHPQREEGLYRWLAFFSPPLRPTLPIGVGVVIFLTLATPLALAEPLGPPQAWSRHGILAHPERAHKGFVEPSMSEFRVVVHGYLTCKISVVRGGP